MREAGRRLTPFQPLASSDLAAAATDNFISSVQQGEINLYPERDEQINAGSAINTYCVIKMLNISKSVKYMLKI